MFEAFNRADLDAASTFLAPDVTWHDQRELPGTGIHHGRDGVRAHLLSVMEDLAEYRVEARGVCEIGDHVLVHSVISARGRAAGVPVQREAAILCTLAARQITRMQIFGSEDEALHAIVT